MPQIVNFDTVTCDIVEVKKTVNGEPRVWKLRDDVSAEVIIRFFELARAQDAAVQEAVAAGDGVVASFHAADDVYLRVLLDIFRHTYPETTGEELRADFSFEERKRLVDLFFSLAGIVSSAPSNGAPNSTPRPATPSLGPTTMPPQAAAVNRAARRASSRTKKPQEAAVTS